MLYRTTSTILPNLLAFSFLVFGLTEVVFLPSFCDAQILPTSPTQKKKQKNSNDRFGSAFKGRQIGKSFNSAGSKKVEYKVQVEVLYSGNLRPEGGLEWLKLLREAGCSNARLRLRQSNDRIEIKQAGRNSETKLVFVELDRGVLITPSGTLRLGNKKSVKAWVDSLRFPPKEPEPQPAAFGLNEVELVAVHLKLSKALTIDTSKKKPEETILSIRKAVTFPLQLKESHIRQILDEEVPPIQLKGVSGGTALASFLRLYGLVFYPKKNRTGQIELIVESSAKAKEYWPVGWPAPGLPIDRAPKIFKSFLPDPAVKSIQQAMFDISAKSGVPILIDHNTLLPSGFDPEKKKRIFNGKKTNYRTAVGRWWKQDRKSPVIEIRMDEAEKPFLWISGKAN